MNVQTREAKLRVQLGQLERRLALLKKDLSKSHSSDSSEQALERENDEVLQGIGQETQSDIADIRAALARIDTGKYGVCARCGKAINSDRLDVLPAAAYCVTCAAG